MFRNIRTFDVNFHITARLQKGQTLGVVGNLRALGSDSKSNPLLLATTPDRYPLWYNLQSIYVPFNFKMEFRLAIYENKQFIRFEEREYPYIIEVSSNMDISAVFNEESIRVLPRFNSDEQKKLLSDTDSTTFNPSITFVAQWLPIKLSRTEDGRYTAVYDDIHPFLGVPWKQIVHNGQSSELKFIGCINTREKIPVEDQPRIEKLLNSMGCYPLYVPETEFKGYYYGFCKQILWPLLHDVVDLYCENETPLWDNQKLNDLYTSYTYVNQMFARKITQIGGDIIWIHGYHLMLVPSCISLGFRANSRLAMFFHTPFPSSDIFRVLPMRNDLLQSIMSCNHIGFHIYEYLRHFQNAVRRILGIQMHVDNKGRPYFDNAGRKVLATASFVGVEPKYIEHTIHNPKVAEYTEELKAVTKNKIVFTSVQYLERLKGIPLQMETIKCLLRLHKELIGKIVILVYCLNAQSTGRDYEISQDEVIQLANEINTTFAKDKDPIVIVKQYDKLDMTYRMALWSVTDILLCVPIREGLNVIPLEYVCARQFIYGRCRDILPGVVVLSEFTSSARCMSGALYINPWNVHESTDTYYRAIEMTYDEKLARWDKFINFVFSHSCSNWVNHIFSYIMNTSTPSLNTLHYSLGLGLGRKVLGLKPNFEKVNVQMLIKKFKSSSKRVIFFDYGGTIMNEDSCKGKDRLLAMEGRSKFKTPSKAVIDALKTICKYTDTHVYILSGRSKEELTQTLGKIRNLGIAAEEGFYYKLGDKDEWEQLIDNVNDNWRCLCRNIMEKYVYRTNGSFIEEKGSSLVWQYKDSDPDFGSMQAQDLEDSLSESLEGFPVEVLKGMDYIEVRPKGINKGAFMKHILRYYEAKYLLSLTPQEMDVFTSSMLINRGSEGLNDSSMNRISSNNSIGRVVKSTSDNALYASVNSKSVSVDSEASPYVSKLNTSNTNVSVDSPSIATTNTCITNDMTATTNNTNINNMSSKQYKQECRIKRNSSKTDATLYNSISSVHSSKSSENLNRSLLETIREMERINQDVDIHDGIQTHTESIKTYLPDFIWCVGDDTTDESMFKAAHEYMNETINPNRTINIFTCTVGQKPSEADSYFFDTNAVIDAMVSLQKMLLRSISVADLSMNAALYKDSSKIPKAFSLFNMDTIHERNATTSTSTNSVNQPAAVLEESLEDNGAIFF